MAPQTRPNTSFTTSVVPTLRVIRRRPSSTSPSSTTTPSGGGSGGAAGRGGGVGGPPRRANGGVPNRFVGAIEFLVEYVNEQARSIIHGDIRYIAPLALTVFVWIVFMNTLDLVPVDLVPAIVSGLGISHYQRILPTADLNATLAMSIVVLLASLYYGVKIKKAHFFGELVSAPFGSGGNSGIGLIFKPILWVCNFAMQIIEYLSKTVSLGMRLFGNMFAGEMVFMLLALLGALATWWGAGLHFVLGLIWAIFHILIIVLQGFIFMMLTLIYRLRAARAARAGGGGKRAPGGRAGPAPPHTPVPCLAQVLFCLSQPFFVCLD